MRHELKPGEAIPVVIGILGAMLTHVIIWGTVLGVIVWAIVKLVNHYTGG